MTREERIKEIVVRLRELGVPETALSPILKTAKEKSHECRRSTSCSCDIIALEPNESCPVHGSGEWPPRCVDCGRLMRWPTT